MEKDNKYENTNIVKNILSEEFERMGDKTMAALIITMNLEDPENKKWLKDNINHLDNILNKALKELEV